MQKYSLYSGYINSLGVCDLMLLAKHCNVSRYIDLDDINIAIDEYYLNIRSKETLPFTTPWMYLENITLSERIQTQKDKHCTSSRPCGI